MSEIEAASIPRRLRIGQWLNGHRAWGILPLLLIGLFVQRGEMSVRAGILMMVAGGIGIFSGTLLRIMCRTFTQPRGEAVPSDPTLITNGPFAISRNPVYLAEAAIALSIIVAVYRNYKTIDIERISELQG